MGISKTNKNKSSNGIVALIIGRRGSSLKNKNILPVLGRPLLHYTAAAARESQYIGRFYASSDCPAILEAAAVAGYKKIVRPPDLSTATSQSVDVVHHALVEIEKYGQVEVLVVQHANVGTITTQIIDDCIEQLLSDESLSSVVPVHEKNEYNPYRCKMLNSEKLLEPFFKFSENNISCNRQDLPPAYFFDHSIWVLNVKNSIKSKKGQPPWTCMGSRIKPYITKGCFDVHDIEDIKKTEQWIIDNDVALPKF